MMKAGLSKVLILLAFAPTAFAAAGAQQVFADAGAFPIPPVLGIAAPYWITADGFSPGQHVTVTLTTPSGIMCETVDEQSGGTALAADDAGVVQGIVAPASCAAG